MRNRQRNGRAGSRGSALPHRTRAFTLAEVLIALALMALLITAAALGISAANQSHTYNSEKSDLVAKVRGTLDRIVRDVHRAQSVESPDSRTIVVTLAGDVTHTYQWDGTTGGTITMTVDDGGVTAGTLADGVQTFTVTDDREPTFQIRLVLAGEQATTEAVITATPRKEFF